MLVAALLGFVFGWLGSVPVAGPISALVVTRGIEGRMRAGLFIALGGGIAEAFYAFLAFWGFSTYLIQYPVIVPISRAGGAIVLVALGISFLVKPSKERSVDYAPRDSAWSSFALGAWLCLINPTLIATWSAVVTTLYSTEAIDFESSQALPFAVGCGLGIAGWYFVVLWLIHRYRERFSRAILAKVVRVIGALLLVLAAWFAVRFVQYFVAPEPAPGGAPSASAAPSPADPG
jgi:threonine/homoserine/homoserine lactone efflux protein